MKKRFFPIWIMIIALVICLAGNRDAMAYTIDGNVADWGIDLSSATSKGYLDTNLPSGGWDVDVVTEDNADIFNTWTLVGPLYSYYNYFDAEAMYFDNDQSYAYIAIVTGLPEEGYDPPGNTAYNNLNYAFKPGDIFIDADDNGTYEYGIDITTFDSTNMTASLMNVTSANPVYYNGGTPANPWEIAVDTNEQSIDFVYSDTAINTHYVLEAAIPLSYLGLSANPGDPVQNIGLHWTMECGNDCLNLDADVNPVSEPKTMLLLGAGLIGLAGFTRRRFKK